MLKYKGDTELLLYLYEMGKFQSRSLSEVAELLSDVSMMLTQMDEGGNPILQNRVRKEVILSTLSKSFEDGDLLTVGVDMHLYNLCRPNRANPRGYRYAEVTGEGKRVVYNLQVPTSPSAVSNL